MKKSNVLVIVAAAALLLPIGAACISSPALQVFADAEEQISEEASDVRAVPEETSDVSDETIETGQTTNPDTSDAGTASSSDTKETEKKETAKETTDSSQESASIREAAQEQAALEDTFQADEAVIEENFQYSVVKNQTTEEFIESICEDAQEVAWENDLYASVMLAQAILETGSGGSQLSQSPNYNLFGIKGRYEGKSVTFSTQEDDGDGNLYTVQATFKKYPSYKESIENYAELLTGGLTGNSSFYQYTWKSMTDSYEDATDFLTGRYATDTNYDKKLNTLIEAYELTQYDEDPEAAVNDQAEAPQETKYTQVITKKQTTTAFDAQHAGTVIPE